MKEIRWENKHIDFNQALDKECPNILKDKDIAYPHRVIAAFSDLYVGYAERAKRITRNKVQ